MKRKVRKTPLFYIVATAAPRPSAVPLKGTNAAPEATSGACRRRKIGYNRCDGRRKTAAKLLKSTIAGAQSA